MKIETGDYVILDNAGKGVLVRVCYVSKSTKGKYKGTLEKIAGAEPTPPFEFKEREIIAHLGRAPRVGTAYGVRIEPQLETLDLPFVGESRVFVRLDDNVRSALCKSFKSIGKGLKHLPQLAVECELRQKQGSMVGKYSFRKNKDTDILSLYIESSLSTVTHAFYHEYGHGLWARFMSPRMRMKWVSLYHKSIKTTTVSKIDLKQLREDLVSNGDISSFYKSCEEDDRMILRAIWTHIKRVHSLTKEHIQWAISTEYPIDDIWPTSIELSAKEKMLTEYSLVSPEEFWAEALSLKMQGIKLPSKVSELLESTLSRFSEQ